MFRLLARIGRGLLLGGLSLFFVVGVLFVESIPRDVGWLAAALAVSALLARYHPTAVITALARLGGFVLALSLVYFIETQPQADEWLRLFLRSMLVLIAIGIALELKFGEREFRLNPLDVIVVLIVVTVPNMEFVHQHDLRAVVVEALLLLYAVEMTMLRDTNQTTALPMVISSGLAILAARTLCC
jgi:hypothetical protein